MILFIYLFNCFVYRLAEFFRHWYVNSFKIYGHFIVSLLEKFDRKIAFKITLRHLFEPLFQDYSVIGHILGFFFRFWRLFFGAVFYFFILAAALIVYVVWTAVPIFIVAGIFNRLLLE